MDAVITATSWNWCKAPHPQDVKAFWLHLLNSLQTIEFVDIKRLSALQLSVSQPFSLVMGNDLIRS